MRHDAVLFRMQGQPALAIHDTLKLSFTHAIDTTVLCPIEAQTTLTHCDLTLVRTFSKQ